MRQCEQYLGLAENNDIVCEEESEWRSLVGVEKAVAGQDIELKSEIQKILLVRITFATSILNITEVTPLIRSIRCGHYFEPNTHYILYHDFVIAHCYIIF